MFVTITSVVRDKSLFLADLKAQTAAVETRFVHGAVLLHKPAGQLPILEVEQLAMGVVVHQPLGQVEKGTQLAQGAAVRLYLRCIVLRPEEGVAVIQGDVTALVNDMQQAGLQDLKEKRPRKRQFEFYLW